MKERRYCSNCGNELPEDWNDDLCPYCMDDFASAAIHVDGIYPNVEDFF